MLNSIKLLYSIALVTFLSSSFSVNAQKYADPTHYLIEGLEIDKVSNSDKHLIDSCLEVYHKAAHDTIKIQAITVIIETSWDDNVWPKYNLWLYELLKKKIKKPHNEKAKKYLLNSYAGTINNIGFNYKNQGDIEKALEYYHKSVKIKEQVGDKKGIATGLNNIAIILDDQGEIEGALKYYHTCLDLQREVNDLHGVARSYSNIGLVYFNENDLNKAILYSHKAIKLQEEIGDKKGLGTSLNNLAAIYNKQGNTLRAIEYHEKSFALEEEIGNKQGQAWSANNLARAYHRLKQYDKALDYCDYSMNIAKEIEMPLLIQNSASTFMQIYEAQHDGMKALKMHKLYISMRDTINNTAAQKATAKQLAQYEYEKQKTIDDANHDKILLVKQEEKEKQQIITIAIGVGLALVIVFLIFVFNRLQLAKKQKIVIETQNQEIVDSITYAKRIQEAILPTSAFIKEQLPDSFVLYKPKDIIAGDFYWMHRIGDHLLFAVADCTGHGVPGAMVSVVCDNALNSVINDAKLLDPGKILDETRKMVVQRLNQSRSGNSPSMTSIKDGMDIALCVLNVKTNELQFSGAYNSLYHIKGTEINELKATRQPIGQIDNPTPFKTHQISVEKGDALYLFTDGYADQFGGPKGKKFMYKPFKKLLTSLQNEPMENQKTTLDKAFEDWRGNMEQIDDVCVIGVRI